MRCQRGGFADRRGDAAGAYATDQEARLALANALEDLYDANPALDFGDRPREIEDASLDGQKDLPDASGTILYSLSIIQE